MTQSELITLYVKLKGSITPATLRDSDRSLQGHWIGSEVARVCRKLRDKKVLTSVRDGRFEKFYLAGWEKLPEYTAANFLKQFPSKIHAEAPKGLF